MAEAYRFFGGTVDDPRQYNQIEFAEVLERFFQNGYFPDVGGELQVAETDPPRLAIRVASGQAWINGYWYKNDDWKEIDLAPADVTYARIDRVVLRLDTVNDRNILAIVKTGTPSATPVAPNLERTEQYWELGLATVYVAAGVTSVTNANITDTRQGHECGKAVPRNTEIENHLNDNTPHREAATLHRKNKDENGIYTRLEWYRADGTLFKTSELEGESPQYATRRVKFYAEDGQTLVQEIVYILTYDENGELISEVIHT